MPTGTAAIATSSTPVQRQKALGLKPHGARAITLQLTGAEPRRGYTDQARRLAAEVPAQLEALRYVI